jgi:hypothetical protein
MVMLDVDGREVGGMMRDGGAWFCGEPGGVDDAGLEAGDSWGREETEVIMGDGGVEFWVEVGGVDGVMFKIGVSGVVGGGGGVRDCERVECGVGEEATLMKSGSRSGVDGKRNWLFCWGEDGLESKGVVLAAESWAESKRVEAAETRTEMGIDEREEAGE